ncbi:sigma-70 family RNA polymerase sigma factor [Caulobacter mirabilis]|uniref:sigma-70 family RNA polymerase sigma factor n=1 Tax=Caulobacter mirabilis TaxID=69666 RepID=UPI001FECA72F|nr:sigma-70 family RNA polymerase sigma factor [Caulobacter mirabilis]
MSASAPPSIADQRRTELASALRRTASGDRAALEEIYRSTSGKLLGVVLRILPDRQEAEDVLQDVYLTVWRKADMFDAERASPITWLAALARNRAIDRIRSRGGRRFVSDDVVAEQADAAPLASEQLETGEDAARLKACLEQLEQARAEGVRQAFFGGLTYETLARRAGVPLGTMKSWMRRSLLRLRACLGGAHV